MQHEVTDERYDAPILCHPSGLHSKYIILVCMHSAVMHISVCVCACVCVCVCEGGRSQTGAGNLLNH